MKKSTTKSTTSTTNTYKRITKGIYKTPNGTYRVRKTINGTKYNGMFTSISKAKTYYKSLIK